MAEHNVIALKENGIINRTISENTNVFYQLDASDVQLNIEVKENASLKLFIQNRSKNDTKFSLHMKLFKDAYCEVGFLDLEDHPFQLDTKIILCQEGSDFTISTGQLCQPEIQKVNAMEVLHNAHDTSGQMKNFAVLSNKGHYEMVANGNIEKGCYQASSHQATRVLTLGKDHYTKVIPLLLIDENEVQASHALTIGQPDEEQLYYLQSRGLTPKQAVGLLSVGYFLPIINLIEDEELRDQLRQEMEEKVGLYGSK